MNSITAFLIDNIVAVFFFYGLAFFVLGVALVLASRQESKLRLIRTLRPLAAFGLLHGIHEWIEMFQQITALTAPVSPGLFEEITRVVVLISSFIMLFVFGAELAAPEGSTLRTRQWPVALSTSLWGAAVLISHWALAPTAPELVAIADVWSRYLIAIPAALLAAWGLMSQQRALREQDMPQFGRDLVWASAALLLYGAVGQIFVRQSILPISAILSNNLFLSWFGIPVQLFRGAMASLLMLFMVRGLRALEFENRRRLEDAIRQQLDAQTRMLNAERVISQEREDLNRALETRAQELALLLDLSNMLGAPKQLADRLTQILEQIVVNLAFSDAGLIMLAPREGGEAQEIAATGFLTMDPTVPGARIRGALELGKRAIASSRAVCRHLDGTVIEFTIISLFTGQDCWMHNSPTTVIALPLATHERVIGAIVFVRAKRETIPVSLDELKLMAGIARQLGLSIENALLYQQAQAREKTLGQLLYQVVGAQESERQRIARELHDAIGQSLSAIALGLRGLENSVETQAPALIDQLEAVRSFATNALGELRQVISDLRPPQLDDLGLVAALRWYVQSFRARNPTVAIDIKVSGEQMRLPPNYETVIFRVMQEALSNVAKHAAASSVLVALDFTPTQVALTVKDDGRGFDPTLVLASDGKGGWGLMGIRERALLLGGQYTIQSEPDKGTVIQLRVPLDGMRTEAP